MCPTTTTYLAWVQDLPTVALNNVVASFLCTFTLQGRCIHHTSAVPAWVQTLPTVAASDALTYTTLLATPGHPWPFESLHVLRRRLA